MIKIYRSFLGLGVCVCVFLSGCASIPTDLPHPLESQIVDADSNEKILEAELDSIIASADVVYLGEVHDNPWHHRIQQQVIEKLVQSGAKPAIGMEAFSNSQTSYLMSYVDGSGASSKPHANPEKRVARLRERLAWSKSRDTEWDFYFPLIDLAANNGLPLFGIDLPAGIRNRVTRSGIDDLTPIESRLVIDTGFDNNIYREIMEQEFVRAHCGWNNPELLEKLYQTWIARNDAMATAVSDMLSRAENLPIVVILGKGHTRYNMGVYERVSSLNPGVKQVNIGLTPVQVESQSSEDYFDLTRVDNAAKRMAYEYFWFTPSVQKVDPCVQFSEQLKIHSSNKTNP